MSPSAIRRNHSPCSSSATRVRCPSIMARPRACPAARRGSGSSARRRPPGNRWSRRSSPMARGVGIQQDLHVDALGHVVAVPRVVEPPVDEVAEVGDPRERFMDQCVLAAVGLRPPSRQRRARRHRVDAVPSLRHAGGDGRLHRPAPPPAPARGGSFPDGFSVPPPRAPGPGGRRAHASPAPPLISPARRPPG